MRATWAEHEPEVRARDSVVSMPSPVVVSEPDAAVEAWPAPIAGTRDTQATSLRRHSDPKDPLGGSRLSPAVEGVLTRRRGKGQPLPVDIARSMGEAMGVDLSDVRVHTGPEPAELARSVQATAFTQGSDIYFGADTYAPRTPSGQRLLAHELAHTAQRGGADGGVGVGPIIGRAADPAEAEADRVADGVMRVLRRRATDPTGGPVPSGAERRDPMGGDHRPMTVPISRLRRLSGHQPGALVPLSQQAGVIRRAGDKIAFEAKKPPTEADEPLIAKIDKAVKVYQSGKRKYKDAIERDKDRQIEEISKKEEADVAKLPKNLADGEFKNKRQEIQDPAKAAKVQVLKEFHEAYQKSGWQLEALREAVLQATENLVEFGPPVGDEIPILNAKTKQQLYAILTKEGRFEPPVAREGDTDLINPAFEKKGTKKQYVKDARGLAIGRFVYRGCDSTQMMDLFKTGKMHPRNQTDVIGKQIEKFNFGDRKATEKITQAEREYLQQRDGSGDDQRMLSVTHAKPTRKVHSNHGEEFTSTATIKIDLAKVDASLIYNLHLPESHAFKTSLARKDQKKSARQEMKLYVYSAEKNRETLLIAVPEEAVVEVQIANKASMTPYAAKRMYNVEFNKQELAREKKQRDDEAAKEREAIAAKKKQQQQADAEASAKAEAEKKGIAAGAEVKRLKLIEDELADQASKQVRKLKGSATELEKLWSDAATYLAAYEKKRGKQLNPSLIMLTDLQDVLKFVKESKL